MSSLKPHSPFPFSIVPSPLPPSRRPSSATVIRLSRWNNANAEPHLRRRREQQQIEDDIRRHRRHHSAAQIASPSSFPSPTAPPPSKSLGTPSSPSPPSIPGKSSKYSKPPLNPKPPPHPAFRRQPQASPVPIPASGAVSLTDRGIAYRVDGAPFEFQYSYTETPKVKPLALREPPFLPFGPSTMPRPWTGRAPLPPSKKKLPEFDSFKLPPPGKKGVKPVQSPGPFVAGSGPRYTTASREEVLGEPLTEVEVKELVKGSLRVRRLLNIGRDGLTHNMLENIHAHWKRRRICKIKCIGVCTVDMDNVRQQLEEKTGGKIIYNRGGVIFLFRGRNYNYRTRPRYPLMLWKPVAAVYPRLVPKVPKGLTPHEATEMRKKGHKLPPICKIGKNGLYSNLVQHVREAFEECELVRINCTGLNKSDYKKIGAKLQDLVPCILLSFAYEHILMWRGKDWKSSLPSLEDDSKKDGELIAGEPKIISRGTADSLLSNQEILNKLGLKTPMGSTVVIEDVHRGESEVPSSSETTADQVVLPTTYPSKVSEIVGGSSIIVDQVSLSGLHQEPPISLVGRSSEDLPLAMPCESFARVEDLDSEERKDVLHPESELEQLPTSLGLSQFGKVDTRTSETTDELETATADSSPDKGTVKSSACLDGVMLLLKQAVDGGSAIILDDVSLDANIVYERCVALAKTAPRGPVFQQRIRKATVKRGERPKVEEYKEKLVDVEVAEVSAKRGNERKKSSRGSVDIGVIPSDVVPHGSLGVDELAKLLA